MELHTKKWKIDVKNRTTNEFGFSCSAYYSMTKKKGWTHIDRLKNG